MTLLGASALLVTLAAGAATAGAHPLPRPFPQPGAQPREVTQTVSPRSTPDQAATDQVPLSPESADAPTEDTLGLPIYPNARFIASYDAGRRQRYYLFGTNASFQEMVSYYAIVLEKRGERVFEEPPVHMFEIGRYREQTMAFPPGVTIKDYTWNGAAGYANPTPGAQPTHYRTVIQIVPAPSRR